MVFEKDTSNIVIKGIWIAIVVICVIILLVISIKVTVENNLFYYGYMTPTETAVHWSAFGIGVAASVVFGVILTYRYARDTPEEKQAQSEKEKRIKAIRIELLQGTSKERNQALRKELRQLTGEDIEDRINALKSRVDGAGECPCGGNECLTCGGHESDVYDLIKKVIAGDDVLKEVDSLHDMVAPKVEDILILVRENKEKLKKAVKNNHEARKTIDHLKHLIHDVKSTHRDLIHELEDLS